MRQEGKAGYWDEELRREKTKSRQYDRKS